MATTNEMAAPTPLVLIERRDRAAWLRLNRSQTANALSRALVAELQAALDRLATETRLATEARLATDAAGAPLTAVVLASADGRTFCAGADLKERLAMSMGETRDFLDALGTLVQAIADFPRPVIAALSGAAMGGGLEIALACDFRIASESASMGLSEVRLGIIPGAGGTQRLARLCGIAVAKELILTGRRISAAEALRMGLVAQVTPDGELDKAVETLCAELASAAPLALAAAKQAIDRGCDEPMTKAIEIERACYESLLATHDRNEGLRAFAEKRPPCFQGK
jgi:enoyl-CoA hydratase/carnithine racemase